VYSNDEWDILLDEGDLYTLYDCYLAHEAAGIPVPLNVLVALDDAGYKVEKWKDEDNE
jgi:hypothetical protein